MQSETEFGASGLEQVTDTNAASGASEQRRGFIYAVVAVLMFASSAVLVLYADPIPSLEKTFWRMVVATSFVYALIKLRGNKVGIARRDLPRFVVYGLIAATHFSLYIASLNFTSAAHALTIVYTSPIFVTVFSALLLKEPVKPRKWLGIVIAAIGVAVLAGFEPKLSWQMLLGDLMAFGSAIMYGLYSIAGRRERDNYPLLNYACGVYGFATLWLLPLAILSFMFGAGISNYSLGPILAILALGIVPLGIGHTLYNGGLRRLHATYVNIIATQEVTFGIILTWLLRNQVPSLNSIIGAVITLLGIVLVLLY